MAVITTDEVKVFLQISDASKDDLIDALIPVCQDNIIEYCNDTFATGFPVGMKIYAAQMIGYDMALMSGGGSSIGMQSEDQGEYSYDRGTASTGQVGEYPASVLAGLNKWRKTRAHFGSKMQANQDRRGMTPAQLATGAYVQGVDGVVLNED